MGDSARKSRVPHSWDDLYGKIYGIDGRHPYKDKVPFSYVEYPVKRRKGGRVAYFNFHLAREMGLIPKDHGDRLTAGLTMALLESFGNVIINEYDLMHGARLDGKDVKPHRYMATRYLQLQHPSRTGLTSGDGRSIWNGTVRHRGTTWDVTSRGTGATCLSPARAKTGRFYKTGDPGVSYGCGYSVLLEGMSDVVFSEVFALNGIASERVLCVLEYPGGYCVTVRAGRNLLRPSHLFLHLKQGRLDRLKAATDYFIERQIANGVWTDVPEGPARYDYFLERVTETFARMAAKFEAEYIFCWLDWDGDNILIDGGIIDFGSIRQFGLYHHEYRFDDDERWSTNVKEQKIKARYIVQTFAQLVDFLKTGRKKPHLRFRRAACLRRFNHIFKQTKRDLLLHRIGFSEEQATLLKDKTPKVISEFERVFYALEAVKSRRGPVKVPDGITWNAVFCMRDILRELPRHYAREFTAIEPKAFIDIMRSSYAQARDVRLTMHRRRQVAVFQKMYMKMIETLAKFHARTPAEIASGLTARASFINRFDRITGDSIVSLAEELVKSRRRFSSHQFYKVIQAFTKSQTLDPDRHPEREPQLRGLERRMISKMIYIVRSLRESL